MDSSKSDKIENIPLMPIISKDVNVIKCIYLEKTYEVNVEPFTFINELIPSELQGTFNVIHFGTKLHLNKCIEYYAGRFKQYGNMVHLTPPTQSNVQQMIPQERTSTPDELYVYLVSGILCGFLFSVFTMIPLRMKSDEYTIFRAGCVVGLTINVGLKLFMS